MHTLNLLHATFHLLLSPCSSSFFAFVHSLPPFILTASLYIHFLFPCLTTRNSHTSTFQLSLSLLLHYLAFHCYSQIFKICFYSTFTVRSSVDLSPLLLAVLQILSLVSFKCFSLYSYKLARFISIILY